MPTVRDILIESRQRLIEAGVDAPRMDADLLIAQVLGVNRAGVMARRSQEMALADIERVRALVARRAGREPLAYITGRTDFYSREFLIEPGVLIPRVDTEVVVEGALKALLRKADESAGLNSGEHAAASKRPQSEVQCPMFLELGTGSGCICVTLLAELPEATGTGVDLSPVALKVTRANAEKHSVAGRLNLLQGSWFEPLPTSLIGSLDLVIANPPYVPEGERGGLQPEVALHEPALALFAAGDGTANYALILEGARKWLKLGGRIVLELGFGQAEAVSAIARNLSYTDVYLMRDTASIERVLVATHQG